MGPDRSFLIRPSVPTIDVGVQEEAYPNSCYNWNVQATNDSLRVAEWLFLSRADVDTSSSGTLMRHPAWVNHRSNATPFGHECEEVFTPHRDADAGNRKAFR